MRYVELKSIWQEDLSGLNGAALSRVYFERAVEILRPRSVDASLYSNWGVIDLDRARELIGCGRSVLYKNQGIRAIIDHLQQRDLEQKPAIEDDVQSNVIQFPIERTRKPSRYEIGKIVVADVVVPLAGGVERVYTIPTLLWAECIDEQVSDYLRAKAIAKKSPRTLYEYAKILREFRRFCRERNIAWNEVTDQVLTAYRVWKQNQKVQTRRCNTIVGVIFQFYVWAEKEGLLRSYVQLGELHEYPIELQNHPFALTSRKFTRKDGEEIRVSTVATDDNDNHPNRHTPSEKERKRVHATETGPQGERNSLSYAWAEDTGARSFEVLQVTVAQLPTREQLDRVFAGLLTWSITVFRKGNRVGKLYPSADLLRRTLDFIDNERNDVVERCAALDRFVSGKLFITPRGTPLTVSALCGLARLAFKRARVEGSYHRFRAVRAQKEVEAALDTVDVGDVEVGPETLWKHSILMRAADILDHRSTRSLEHYLNDLINSRVQKSVASKLHLVQSALNEKERALIAVERRIDAKLKLMQTIPALGEYLRTGTVQDASRNDLQKLKDLSDEIQAFAAPLLEAA